MKETPSDPVIAALVPNLTGIVVAKFTSEPVMATG